MSDETRLGCVIEPTVPVANGLLDVARKLLATLGPRITGVTWVPPHHYVAPLALGTAGTASGEEAAVEALRLAAREIEEFGVQIAPPVLVRDGPTEGRVVAVLGSKGEELANASRVVLQRLGEIGMDVQGCDPMGLTLARVTGEAALQAVAGALPEGRDTPLAGWLVGGLCIHAGPESPLGGWVPGRVQYVPLRRMGSRR